MSGGPYGRGKAPERACLPVGQWPDMDRRLWLAACAAGDILDDEVGARSHHADISNTKAAKGYGRWLTHLSVVERKALDETPAGRITLERVHGLLADKAYDADSLRRWLKHRKIRAAIPSTASRRTPYPLDRAAYRRRNSSNACSAS